MRETAKEEIKGLSNNNNWLFQHMITAFWHGFGISNGIDVKPEDLQEIKYKDVGLRYRIKPEVMQAKLAEYIKWLKQYKASWNTNESDDMEKDDFYNEDHKSREGITKMIELLQV